MIVKGNFIYFIFYIIKSIIRNVLWRSCIIIVITLRDCMLANDYLSYCWIGITYVKRFIKSLVKNFWWKVPRIKIHLWGITLLLWILILISYLIRKSRYITIKRGKWILRILKALDLILLSRYFIKLDVLNAFPWIFTT